MKLFAKEFIVINAPSEKIFDLIVMDLEFLSRGVKQCSLVPGVISAEIVGGNKMAQGSIRRVHLSNGSVLDEEILEIKPPNFMQYKQLKGFGFPQSLLAAGATGFYQCEKLDSGTKVTWGAEFDLPSFIVYPLTYLIIQFQVRPLLRTFLETAKQELE